MATFPQLPSQLRSFFPEFFWAWWLEFKTYMTTGLETGGDLTITTKGKGTVMTNAAGTVTKRVRLNDLGDGVIFEDV
jgi:hypothetical protein